MVPDGPESIEGFIDAATATELTLLLLNRTQPAPMFDLLKGAFERQPVHVVERTVPGRVEDELLLLDDSGVVASSSLSAMAESFLLINADRYRTGANKLAAETVPAVLRELTDIEFEVRGYPASAKEKLLLIVMSRYIEALALRSGAGELHVGFQRLSRLEDEYGTQEVYRELGESSVETHIYGVGRDATGYQDGLIAHENDSAAYRRSWFLTFEPADDDARHMALVAWETSENVWRGTWSFEAPFTRAVADHVRTAL